MPTNEYRPDIDGLRAIAVTLVILYHADLGFSGGFVGVDVFFVISGYLITRLIKKDLSLGTFSLGNFWIRRIRRLLPASLVVTFTTISVAFLLMLPSDLVDLAKSLTYQQLFSANIYFNNSLGYFDQPAALKPFLHYWSLAVEEQFYLIYPLVLWAIRNETNSRQLCMLLIAMLASFASSEATLSRHESAAYFLSHNRCWELLMGAILPFLPTLSNHGKETKVARALSEAAMFLALGTLLAISLTFNETTKFPGINAILPCVATASAIYINTSRPTFLSRLLTSPPILMVGLMSYSLYLWHWPLLVFAKYLLPEFTWLARALTVAISFLLSFASYKYIERPFRDARFASNSFLLMSFLTSTTFAIGLSAITLIGNGFPQRYPPDIRLYIASLGERGNREIVTEDQIKTKLLPKLGDITQTPSLLLWGDSHAMCIANALSDACAEYKICATQATHGSTLPLINFDNSRPRAAPRTYNETVLKYIKDNNINTVMLAGYWARDAKHPQFERALYDTITALNQLKCRVIILQNVPVQHVPPGKAIVWSYLSGRPLDERGISLADYQAQLSTFKSSFARIPGESFSILDPTPFLFDRDGICKMFQNGESIYFDSNHLSPAGAGRLTPLFRSSILRKEAN